MTERPDGIYYEPRALWGLFTGDITTGKLTQLGENNFRNGGKYPVTIKRMVLSTVNQIFDVADSNEDVTTAPPPASTLLSRLHQNIRMPFRQNYTRNPTRMATFCPKPTGQPSTRVWNGTKFTGPGPLFDQVRLDFDHPVYLPRTGSIHCQLSSLDDWSQLAVGNILGDAGITDINASVAYLEAGGLFAGSARVKDVPVQVRAAAAARATDPSSEGWPYPLPIGGAASNVGFPVVDNGVAFFAPENTFSATEFDRLEATRSGSTKILGVSMSFKGLAYANALLSAPFAGDGVLSSLSQRIGCAITTTNGGSGEAWWRPGAPCSLVLDSITPALVYDLVEPITLGPGDALAVEALVSTDGFTPVDVEGDPEDQGTIGISFNGYAAIEG